MTDWLKRYLDYLVYPAVVAWCAWHDRESLGLGWAVMFLVGWLVWTCVEYWSHRLAHEGVPNEVHDNHHVRPREVALFPLWYTPAYLLGLFVVFYLVAGPWWPPLLAGTTFGFLAFIFLHWAVHHRRDWFPALAERHRAHHRLGTVYYGVTTQLWDRLFLTVPPQLL